MPEEYLQFWNNFISLIYGGFCVMGIFILSSALSWIFLLSWLKDIRKEMKELNETMRLRGVRLTTVREQHGLSVLEEMAKDR